MNDRELGLQALTIWYRNAGIQFQGIGFDEVVKYYDTRKGGTFIAALGGATKYAKSSDVESAMRAIALGGFGNFPHPSSFFDALTGEVLSFDYEDAKAALAGTIKDVQGVAAFAVGGLAIYWAIGGLFAVYLLVGRR